ncbi:MAG: DUF262 domain-containing protein [Chloroflexi bacterium]|nr:DUF262 domain-containing protein [Chloroflexota bacterium]MYD48992.1 DUF262 domain-containing protein [Chloroflexota bacterium]
MKPDNASPSKLFSQPIRYEIPPYQRRYVWEQEPQWEPLWEDVLSTAEDYLEGRSVPHFMGTVVLDHRSGENSVTQARPCTVVDGQQRLTTIQLLLDAVQEAVEQRGFSDAAGRLSRLVLNEELFWGNDPDRRFKIWPTAYDQDAFRHAMENELPSESHKNSSIVQAHDFFKDQVGMWLDTSPEEQRQKRVKALEEAVSGLLEFVVIEVQGDEDANVIFETLNARGTPLLQSDLIRNLVVHKADIGNDEEAALRLWNFGDWWQEEVGRGFQARPRIDIFLNNWLTVRTSAEVKAYGEFPAFGNYVDREEPSIEHIAHDIAQLAVVYESMEVPGKRNPDYETFLRRRTVIQVGTLTPVLLWLFTSGAPNHQIAKSVKALESFLVRRMICGLQARSYGQLFIGLLQLLQATDPAQCGNATIDYLKGQGQDSNASLWPKDPLIADSFARLPLYRMLNRGRLRLVLEGIEDEIRSGWAETRAIPERITIEHVLPQGWRENRDSWPLPLSESFSPEEVELATGRRNSLIHSIGNLTLARPELNSSMSNESWQNKRAKLDEYSVLSLNKELLAHVSAKGSWNETAIAARARRLCQAAIKVWPHADGIQ